MNQLRCLSALSRRKAPSAVRSSLKRQRLLRATRGGERTPLNPRLRSMEVKAIRSQASASLFAAKRTADSRLSCQAGGVAEIRGPNIAPMSFVIRASDNITQTSPYNSRQA